MAADTAIAGAYTGYRGSSINGRTSNDAQGNGARPTGANNVHGNSRAVQPSQQLRQRAGQQ